MVVAVKFEVENPLYPAVGDELEAMPAGRRRYVDVRSVKCRAVLGCLDDGICLGVHRGDAVAVFHSVAHVVAVRHAAHAAVVPRGKDGLVAHDYRTHVLAVTGRTRCHLLRDLHEVLVPRGARAPVDGCFPGRHRHLPRYCVPSTVSICRTRVSCRPPSNGVSSHTESIFAATSGGVIRSPNARTLLSLCRRDSFAISGVTHSAARTFLNRFATIDAPIPEPQSTMPRRKAPLETFEAALAMNIG